MGSSMKRILDRSFRYTPSYATNLHTTFERIRRQQAGQGDESAPSLERPRKNVLAMPVRQEGRK
jgi:hypothetical protein